MDRVDSLQLKIELKQLEDETVLCWKGNGLMTEHTAYLRLKQGIPVSRNIPQYTAPTNEAFHA